jgi:hypothetical protein
LVVALIAGLLVLLVLAASQKIHWVGSTDLAVEFVVTDAATGEPIPGAAVEIHSEGGFYEERERRDFRVVASDDGRAAYLCRNSMCFGTSGLFTDTYAVHVPWWRFRVSAPGYETTTPTTTPTNLDESQRNAKEDGPRRAKLVVPVSLRKNPASL